MNRKMVPAFISALFFITTASADYETFNVSGGIGFGFGMGGKLYRSTKTSSTATEASDRFYNYGGGLKFDAGCQYFIMERVALQTTLFYSAGVPAFKQVIETTSLTRTTIHGFGMYGFKLHIVPKIQLLDLLDTYVGVGAGLYFTTHTLDITHTLTSTSQSAKASIATAPSLGFSGFFGLDYPISDIITIFGELGFEQVSFNLSKFKVKESSITGYPELAGGTVYNYEKNASSTNNFPPENVPGSNFQIRFGVRYALF